MKRFIAILLLGAMLVSAFACSEKKEETTQETSAETEASGETEAETSENPEPDLPDVDLNGGDWRTITRMSSSYWVDDIWVEGYDGEVVNDTVYKRNLDVEAKFNCKITNADPDSPTSTIQQLYYAGDDEYDFVMDMMCTMVGVFADGMFWNLNESQYNDFEACYWDTNSLKELSIANKAFMVNGDITTHAYSRARFLYFNKDMIEDYNLTSPYEYVNTNTWTLDNMTALVKSVSKDLDGNGTLDGNDQLGLLQEGPYYFISGAGVLRTENDEDDIPQPVLYSERSVDVLAKVNDLINDKTYAISYDEATKGMDLGEHIHIFNLGRSLFATDHFLFVQNGAQDSTCFKDMESAYGIVPNPKYDENQEEYYCKQDNMTCLIAIPTLCGDKDTTCIIMEYMCWYSHDTLIPAYNELTMKGKRLNDEDAWKNLDICFDSILYELDSEYGWGLGSVMESAYKTGNLASAYAKREKSILNAINKTVEAFQALDEQ